MFLVGCNGVVAGEDAAVGTNEPRVTLGTGTSSFVPIADSGAELELVAGTQGGFHVDVTARIWDLDVEGALLGYEAIPVGSTTPISVPTEIELTSTRVVREGDHWLRAGDFLRMNVSGPSGVVGMELELRVRVIDTSGESAEDVKRALIVDRI